MPNDTIQWYVLGAGALGRLWFCRLWLAAEEVNLLVHGKRQAKVFNKNGITLKSFGKELHVPAKAASSAADKRNIDHLLITTKAYDALPALRSIGARLSPGCKVILFQNGMGIFEQVSQYLSVICPDARVFCASTNEGAYRDGETDVVHAGRGETWIGTLAGSMLNPVTVKDDDLIDALAATGLKVAWEDNLYPKLWQKLAVNCGINGLTAIENCKNGELLSKPSAIKTIKAICAEIGQVTQQLGLDISAADLFSSCQQVLENTADNKSSMLQDIRAGKPTEIEFINDYVSRKAASLGLTTPHNDEIVRQVLALHPSISA